MLPGFGCINADHQDIGLFCEAAGLRALCENSLLAFSTAAEIECAGETVEPIIENEVRGGIAERKIGRFQHLAVLKITCRSLLERREKVLSLVILKKAVRTNFRYPTIDGLNYDRKSFV